MVDSRRTDGVVNVKLYAADSFRPLRAAVPASMVTAYFVANGSRLAGVKIRIVVPDQRNDPFTLGVMWKNGGRRFSCSRPSATIGSEKTTRISFACSIVLTSPVGPALTTLTTLDPKGVWAAAGPTKTSPAARASSER